MNTKTVLANLSTRGVVLKVKDGRLQMRGNLDDDTRQLIRTHKPELLALLTEQQSAPLAQEHINAVTHGFAVPVWSGTLGCLLWWVRDDALAVKFCAKHNISRGLVWTLTELAVAQDLAPDDVRNLHAIKRQFDGMIHPADDVYSAVKILTDLGWLQTEIRDTGGRPEKRVHVHPILSRVSDHD